MKKLTQSEFLNLAKSINPHLSFDNAVYVNKRTNVTVTCLKHGDFLVLASSAFRKLTCPKCDLELRKQDFINKAILIHNNKYRYDKVNYTTNKNHVEIICPKHGSFMLAPGDHLKGYGCSKCSQKYKPTTEEWVVKAKEIHPDYDYSEVKYIDNKTPVKVTCKKHNRTFEVIPNNFLKNIYNCPECDKEHAQNIYSKGTENFIKDAQKIHGTTYDYSKVLYINNKTKVCIICPKHGEFEQVASVHLQGAGCPKCKNKNQTLLYEKLKLDFPNDEILYEVSTEWLKPQRFDIYFPKYNIAIEYDGLLHFIPIEHFGGEIKFNYTQKQDKLKEQKCEKNNCSLFRLKYNYLSSDYTLVVDEIKNLIALQT